MIRLALRNIFRQRLRTALTLAAIVSGVAALVLSGGFVEDSLLQLREATIHSQIGHLQVYRKGYYERGLQASSRYIIERPQALLAQIAALPHVEDVMQRLSFTGALSNGRADVAIVGTGIEPEKEARLGTALAITAGHRLSGEGGYQMLLGEGVAKAAGLAPGARATLLVSTPDGALNSLEFEVVGVFRSFSKEYDARSVLIPWSAAKELLDVDGSNAIVVALDATQWTATVAAALAQRLQGADYEVKRWDELADFYGKTAALYQRQFAVLQVIILVAVLLSVVNSINMSTYERTGELGTLMALGSRRGSVFRLIVTESFLLGLVGAVTGAIVGVVLASVVSAIGIPMPPPPNSSVGYNAAIRATPSLVGMACLIGVIATVAAAILPALRVSRLPVIEALRHSQ